MRSASRSLLWGAAIGTAVPVADLIWFSPPVPALFAGIEILGGGVAGAVGFALAVAALRRGSMGT